ncbi:MAG: sulfur oxidation c-type cytochrome SoxA [Gammaproteobacteria bacterium]|nr:sulfur oxidation c-type cytochrome SoxA [Gammaproteobacteria bacterium]
MIRVTTGLATAALLVAATMGQAGVLPEVQNDIDEFRGHFKKRFSEVNLERYQDGVNSLPQYAERRANWELLMEFPPYEQDMETARELWAKPFKNGKTFADCFDNNPPATKYPYWDETRKEIRTIELDINECLSANGEEPIKNLKTGKIAMLVAAFREQFNGQEWAVDIDSPGAKAAYDMGKKYYWTKRGQLNFSCANCHVHNAGNKLRGDVLSAGLGHTTGFPVYRTKWAVAGKPWGTVHRRYGGCNSQVRAEPLKPQSAEYRALELYEAAMSSGIPLKVPSQRQ